MVVGNLFFMIASSILMGIICTVLTERFRRTAPWPLYRRGSRRGDRRPVGQRTARLKYAGRALLGFVVVIGLLTAPPIPWGILRNRRPAGSWPARPS